MNLLIMAIISALAIAPKIAFSATLDDAISTCAKSKGSAKVCCSKELDDPDDSEQCIQQTLDLRYATSPQTNPVPTKKAGSRQSGTQTESSRKAVPKYRIGDGFEIHNMSHLPVGDWKMKKDWGTSMSPIGNLTKDYGAKALDFKLFEKKLFAISDVIKDVPVLNPPRGCAPRLAPAIDDVYDPTDQFSKKQPLRGKLVAGCFKLYERKKKKNGVVTTEWEPDHETRQYIIEVNNLGGLQTNNSWTEGPSSIRPLDQMFPAPVKIGELQGFPIYARHLEPNGKPQFIFTVISRPGVEPFLPVKREQFTKALVNTVEREFKEKESWRPPEQRSKELLEVLARYKQQLASLKPEEKDQQACYLNSKHLTWGEGSVATDTRGCRPIARINPAILNHKAPRSAIQFVLITQFDDIQESYLDAVSYNQRDGKSHFRTTIDMINQTDWKKIQGMIDKP